MIYSIADKTKYYRQNNNEINSDAVKSACQDIDVQKLKKLIKEIKKIV